MCYFNPSASPVVFNPLLIGICLFAYCFLFYFICKITLNNSNFQIFMFFFQQSCISLLLLIDVAKIQHFRFLPMRFVRFAWIREIKYRKYHEIILKISPIKKIWKLCWGDEVKGEGYILNLYIIFFFRAFRFLTLGSFFELPPFFFTHAYIYK